MTVVTAVTARAIVRGRETADLEADRTDLIVVIHTPIENQSITEQSASLDAFASHGGPNDLS